MPVKFKPVEKGQPGVLGGGEKKFYAAPVYNAQAFTLERITKGVERASTVSGADIRAVLYASVEEIADALGEGYIVRFGDLGSFRVSFGSEGKENPEEVTDNTIRNTKVIFTPGVKLREMLLTLKYKKA